VSQQEILVPDILKKGGLPGERFGLPPGLKRTVIYTPGEKIKFIAHHAEQGTQGGQRQPPEIGYFMDIDQPEHHLSFRTNTWNGRNIQLAQKFFFLTWLKLKETTRLGSPGGQLG